MSLDNIKILKKSMMRRLAGIICLFFIWHSAFAQEKILSGKVLSAADHRPLVGVVINIEGEGITAVSGIDGSFSLSPVQADVVVRFNLTGFQLKKIKWTGDGPLDVLMVPDGWAGKRNLIIKNLQKKLEGVDGNLLYSIPAENAAEVLKGRAAGVYINSQTGQPGADPLIQIRGLSTLMFNHDPVILLDGTPVLSMADIDFNDIASVEVLKDAASLALYGRKGANGVVLVTTKRGKSGKNSVRFSARYGIQSMSERYDLLNGQQAFELHQELNQPYTGLPEDRSVFWGDEFVSGSMVDQNNLKNINWQDELFQTAHQQNYSLTFSGGSEQTSFSVSGSYFERSGIVKPSDFSRFAFSFNLDHQISDKVSVGSNIYFTKSRQHQVNIGSSADQGGVILSALASSPYLPVSDGDISYFINPARPEINNVYATIHGVNDRYDKNQIIPRFFFNAELIDGLSLQANGSANVNLTRRSMFMSTQHTYLGRVQSGKGIYSGHEFINYTADALLSYDKDFGDHSIGVMGGYRFYGSKFSWNETIGVNFPTDDVKELSGASTKFASSNINEFGENALIGQISYNLDSRYFITVNLRAESSSRFSDSYSVKSDPVKPEEWEIEKDRTWGTYQGFAVAWNVAEESFLSSQDIVSNMKLRFSYGVTGNDGGYHNGRIYPVYWTDTLPGLNPDEDLTEIFFPGVGYPIRNIQTKLWESMSEMDVGIDLGFVENRFNVSAGYFNRRMKDLILPDFSDTSYSNLGEMTTSGIELGINTLNVITSSFSWSSGLYATMLNQEVSSLGGQVDRLAFGMNGHSNVLMEGESPYAFWGYQTDGIFQNQQEVNDHATQAGAVPGDIRYINQNEDDVIDENDRVVLGNPNPDMLIGFDNLVRIGNIELSLFLQGVMGKEVLNLTRMQTEGFNDFINASADALERWTSASSSTEWHRAAVGDNNIRISDRFVEDASYVRIKNLTIGYYLPEGVLNTLKMSHAKIYLTGQNLMTFTKYSGYDPEVSIYGPLGIDYGAYPQAMYLGGGIQFIF